MRHEQEVGVISFEDFRADVALELDIPEDELAPHVRLIEDLQLDSLEVFRMSMLLESYLSIDQLGLVDLAAVASVATLGEAYGLLGEAAQWS